MFFETLKQVFDTFGAAVFVPIVIFIIAIALKVKPKKAFVSALSAGIGLQGFNLLINSYIPIIIPTVNRMVESSGIELPVVDMGWQATAIVAYSTEVGMIFVGLAILIQVVLFFSKWTNIFQPGDLWNNYSYMVWGSMIYLMTKNMALAIGCMVAQLLYTLLFAEMFQKRWSTYYGYPRCTIASLHTVGAAPLAIVCDWIMNKMGLYKIKMDPEEIRNRLGFLGEPITLGLFLGLFIGLVGNITRLNTLAAWGEIASVGIATSAIMAIFPKVAGIFASAFTAITEASKKSTKNSKKGARVWYLSVNDAAGYGEPSTLITGIILIPIMLLIAFILPGNKVLPMVDLIAIPFLIQTIVSSSNGNIFKSIITGTIWFTFGLLMASYTAPYFTEVASQVGVNIPAAGLMITSFAILTNPFAGLIFLAFFSKSIFFIGAVVAVYFVSYFLFKSNREKVHAYLEMAALNPGKDPSIQIENKEVS